MRRTWLRGRTNVSVTGSIVGHLREDCLCFRDATGEMRVEIADNIRQERQVTPADTVRLLGGVDRTAAGVPHRWVKSLALVDCELRRFGTTCHTIKSVVSHVRACLPSTVIEKTALAVVVWSVLGEPSSERVDEE